MAMFLLSGCRPREQVKLVSQIAVDWEDGGRDRVFREAEKMQKILNRLRQLGQRYSADVDPEALAEPEIVLTLSFTDGSCLQHRLKSDHYIRTGDQPWQQTDPKPLQRLQFLLKTLPGD